MGNYKQLKQAVSNVIKTNGTQSITGQVLQNTLLTMINSLGDNYQFVGVATTATNPGTPDQNVFYLAGEGTYVNFSNLTIDVGQLGVLKWNGTWSKQTLEVGAGGGNMILDWNTDVATTRKQVISKLRKPGMKISYKDPINGWINEQYIGTAITDLEWVKDSNWNEISDKDDVDKKLAGKSNVGSVFGGQKVEADGTSKKIEFTNFKKGLTLHIVNLKIASNSYVSLYGYEKGTWKIIQQNVAVGTTINTDLVLPEEVENYPKIAFGSTGNALLTGGYGYIITDLNVEDAAKYLSNIPQINEKISNIEKGILINKWNVTLKAKNGYLINISGVYSGYPYGKSYDYTDITRLNNKLFLFKNLYTTSNSKVSVVFYDIDKTPLQIFTTEILNDYYDAILLAPENSAYFGINRIKNGTLDKDVEIYTVEDITTIENVKELQQKTVLYEKNALVNLPLYVKLNGNMVNPALWDEPKGIGAWTYSNLIPVKPGKTYYFGNQGYYFTYNEKQKEVGRNTGLTSGEPFPENVYFVKFGELNLTSKEDIDVWLSETDEGYQKFGYGLNDLIFDIEKNVLEAGLNLYFPHAGKKGLYVGDSYVVLGIPQGSAKYLKLASYESNGQNGQTITNFIQNMVNNEVNINQIKNCDICFVEGGTNDYGHGGNLFGKYYDEENTDKHLKYELQIFRKTQSEELAYNSVFKDGNFVGSGTVKITIGTENNLSGVAQSVTYSSSDTVESLIDKIVALTIDGYTISKDKNSIYIQRIAEGMNAWGVLDKPDWKIAFSVDLTEAQEVTGYIKMIQNGSGYNEVFGLSPYQLLANNNAPKSFTQKNMCAAMKSTVETIHFFKPEILVCFISQPERAQYATDTITPPYSKSQDDLFNMAEISIRMEDTCKRLGIPFVDGHSIGCTMWSLGVYEYDKLHLKAYGKEILCRLIAKTLNMY